MMMKKTIVFFFMMSCIIIQVQSQNTISSVFNRLLIFNSQNEMMVVKIENRDFWVTPGLYQTENQTLKRGLDSIASTYGIQLKDLKLKGSFLLVRDLNGTKSTSLRNVFTAKMETIHLKSPSGIENIQWLSPQDALKKITFPHINAMIQQITAKPNKVWGGTLVQHKENNQWKTIILGAFYEL